MLQNSTRGFPIFADDATALGTGKPSLSITVKLRKNGGAETTVSPTITDLGDGTYWIVPLAAHRDTLGVNVWKFSATGAVIAPFYEEIVAVDNQTARFGAASSTDVDTSLLPLTRSVISGTAGTGGTTTQVNVSSIGCTLTTTDQLKGRVLIFNKDTTTTALQGQGAPIDGSTTTAITIASGNALTTAPASGDTFTIY